jgi:hypothetical protein
VGREKCVFSGSDGEFGGGCGGFGGKVTLGLRSVGLGGVSL